MLRPRFKSKEMEEEFIQSSLHSLSIRRRLTAGTLLHAIECLWIWQVVVNPDHGSAYFSHHGNEELKRGMEITEALLVTHLGVALACGIVVMFALGTLRIWDHKLRRVFNIARTDQQLQDQADEKSVTKLPARAPSQRTLRLCEMILILLKITTMFLMPYLSSVWPSRRSQMYFVGVESVRNFGCGMCILGLSFEGNLVLILLSLPVSHAQALEQGRTNAYTHPLG